MTTVVTHSGSSYNSLTMHRKSSESSLHFLGSGSSFSSPKAYAYGMSIHKRGHWRSSPSLRSLSTSHFSVETPRSDKRPPMQPTIPLLFCFPAYFTSMHDVEFSTLLQYVLLLVVARYWGDLWNDLLESLLDLPSFPVLVVLGVLLQFFLKKKYASFDPKNSTNQSSDSCSSSVNILLDIEKYYAKISAPSLEWSVPHRLFHTAMPNTTSTNHHHQGDEWGHFADLDDGMDVVTVDENNSCLDQGCALSPLSETDE